MEPYFRFAAVGHRLSPGVDSVGLAGDEAPVDGHDLVLLEQGHDGGEGAAIWARHILGAYERAVEALQEAYLGLVVGARSVVVVGDDVRVLKLEGAQRGEFLVEGIYGGRQGLRRIGRAGPLERLLQERQRCLQMAAVAGLVVEVPEEDALVIAEGGDDVFHIFAELLVELHGVSAERNGRVLHPAGIVHAGLGSGLLAVMRILGPAVVEEDEQRADAMTGADVQEVVDALLEPRGIVLINDTAQKDAHGVESELLGPAQLLVYLHRVVGILAPHLYLINSSGGSIVAPRHPGELRVPGVGLVFRPADSGFLLSAPRSGGCGKGEGHRQRQERERFKVYSSHDNLFSQFAIHIPLSPCPSCARAGRRAARSQGSGGGRGGAVYFPFIFLIKSTSLWSNGVLSWR